jgi:hypothetical protein
MAYYPKERNVNGVFYYGAAGSDQVLETNSNLQTQILHTKQVRIQHRLHQRV